MYSELRGKGQLTIPSEIIKKLKIKDGDMLEINEVNGSIVITPVIVCKKSDVEKMMDEMQIMGKRPPSCLDPLFSQLRKMKEEEK